MRNELMNFTRRGFLKASCGAVAATALLPKWAMAGNFGSAPAANDNILVVVQLAGGNDGLNTVVPIADARYTAARQRIALTSSQTLAVDARTGLHPNLTSLHGELMNGRMAIVQSVGYPAPDLSHFRSTDIWESGVAERVETTGWLGRALDSLYASDAAAMHSIALGYDLPPAFDGLSVSTPVVADPTYFDFRVDPFYSDDEPLQRRAIASLLAPLPLSRRHAARPSAGPVVDLRNAVALVGANALTDAATVRNAATGYTTTVAYPDTDLGNSLKLTAAVIAANSGARIFWVTQDGYDTHDSERGDHDALMTNLDRSLAAFLGDIRAHGSDRRVALMLWSEFGRRVEDNGSAGTDHGTAGPMFLLGTRVRGGLYGDAPNLGDLDEDGNLKYTTDFRRVYASVLADWVGADPRLVLGGDYARLPLFT
jgi:uncharacterized protein (DUF1501 family)